MTRELDRRASPVDRRDWPAGGRRETDTRALCPACGLLPDGAIQHASEWKCIRGLRAEVSRLRREQRTHDQQHGDCESLRDSAKMFADLAERLARRLQARPTGDLSTPLDASDNQLGTVEAALRRVVAELQELQDLTAFLRSQHQPKDAASLHRPGGPPERGEA